MLKNFIYRSEKNSALLAHLFPVKNQPPEKNSGKYSFILLYLQWLTSSAAKHFKTLPNLNHNTHRRNSVHKLKKVYSGNFPLVSSAHTSKWFSSEGQSTK